LRQDDQPVDPEAADRNWGQRAIPVGGLDWACAAEQTLFDRVAAPALSLQPRLQRECRDRLAVEEL
jgi:hypothetical protein